MSVKKNGFFLVALVVLAVLTVGGCALTGAAAVSYQNQGQFGQHITTPVKDFVTMGLVFANNQFVVSKGTIEGEVFTYQSLLKEAQKLGADAIINVSIDKKFEAVSSGGLMDSSTDQKETWYGSALAIKYTDTLKNSTNSTTIREADGTTTTITTTGENVLFNADTQTATQSGGTATPEAEEKTGLFGLW